MLRNKGFIGCNNTFAGFQASFYKGVGRLDPSHNLHHDPDLRIIDDRINIMDDLLLDRISRKVSDIEHIFNIDLISCPLVDEFAVGVDHFHHA